MLHNDLKKDAINEFGIKYVVFNPTFNNISIISWRSVLLVEETGGPGETHRSVANQTNLIT
jgi:hypothetical protein